jgi:hypothetical protein
MASAVRVPKVRFGVSRTEDGDKVLTPFGPFGRCYAYSETLNRRFVITMTIIGWGTALLALAIFAWRLFGRITPIRFFALLIVLIVVADAIRVLSLLALFSRAERLPMGRGIPLAWTSFGQPFAIQTGTVGALFIETIFVIGISMGLPQWAEQLTQWSVTIIFFHLGIYSLRFIHSLYYY